MNQKGFNTKRMAVIALFCAIAYATMFVLRIKVSFLSFDAKDAVITIAAMLFGPGTGALISLIVATLELITVSDTGIYGWVMNFVSSAVFSMLASAIYRRSRKLSAAVVGLVSSVIGMTAVMLVMNLVITPLYTGWSAAEVADIIPTLLLPFNLTKAALNAALVMILYKPISMALKKARITDPAGGEGYHLGGRSLVFMLIGLAVTVVCVFILIYVLDGNFSLIKTTINCFTMIFILRW